MCGELDALRQAIISYGGQFDARCLTPGQAGHVARLCAQVEAAVWSIKSLAAARAAEGDDWRHEGYRSPAHQLAAQAGTSTSAAKRSLGTGQRLSQQPEVARAALAGELSPEQAEAVSDALAAGAAKPGELIDKARCSSLAELVEEVARAKAAVSDQEARHRAVHAKRCLRHWTDRDGALQAHLYGHPEDGAKLWGVLDPLRRRLNVIRRARSGHNEPLDALDYDALMVMACVAAGNDGELGLADLVELGLFPQLGAVARSGRLAPPVPAELPAELAGPRPEHAPGHAPGPRPEHAPDQLAVPTPEHAPGHAPGPGPEHLAGPAEVATRPGPSERAQGPGPGPAPPAHPVAELSSVATGPPGGDDGPGTGPPAGLGTNGPARAGRAKKLAGSPARIMVRVDLDTLLRGFAIEGELCEIAGYGPVPVCVVSDLLANDNAFVVGVLTKSEQLVGVYHHRRRPNAHQRSALDFIYPLCAVAGCAARAGLQYDHREDWARTKFTVLDLLDRLCVHHHALKTRQGWGLVAGTGKRAFVPPADPRHPKHARPLPGAPPSPGPPVDPD